MSPFSIKVSTLYSVDYIDDMCLRQKKHLSEMMFYGPKTLCLSNDVNSSLLQYFVGSESF